MTDIIFPLPVRVLIIAPPKFSRRHSIVFYVENHYMKSRRQSLIDIKGYKCIYIYIYIYIERERERDR